MPREENMMRLGSRVISLIFNPLIASSLGLVAMAAVHSSWRGDLGLIAVFFVLLPIIVLLIGFSRRTWSDLDVSNLLQRRLFMPWVLLSASVGMMLSWLLGFPLILRFVVVSIWLWLGISTAVGFYWKISLHTGANAALVWILAGAFGGRWVLAVVAVPLLVGVARVYGRHHTMWQVLAGAGAGSVAVWIGFGTMGVLPHF